MDDSNLIAETPKLRVSIFERIVPLAAFGLAAVSGAVGGWMIISLLSALSNEENVGRSAVAGGLAEYSIYPLVFLYAACALGVVGICVAIGRMVITTGTSSPSGVSYIILGGVSLVPVGFVWNAGRIILSVLDGTSTSGLDELGATVATYSAVATIVVWPILFALLAWTVIPFKARPGRRFGPLITLIVMEIALVVVAVMFQLRVSELWRINMAS